MKKLRLLALLLVATVPFAACDDEGGTQPDPGSIQGTVVVEGSPLSGVTVAISGPESATATTDANGEYTFQSVPSGSYTIEIAGGAPDDVTFETPSKSATVQGGSTETVNFSGDYIRTAVISGRVTAQTESGEANVENITVNLSGTESATTQTNANGEFTFDGLRAGAYTVSIDASGLDVEFNTTSQQVQVSVGGSAEVNFTGLQPAQAQVSIEDLYTGNTFTPVNRSNVVGTFFVDVTMDPGTETITRVSLSLNGEEVDAQNMSVSSGSTAGAAASSQPTVQFQVNSAMFDPQTLEVQYPNGEYELSASIETAEGSTATATLGTPLTFNNRDRLRVVAVEDGTHSIVAGGNVWYGNTNQHFRAEAITYTQQIEISRIGVTTTAGAVSANSAAAFAPNAPQLDAGSGPGTEHFIEGPAPFEFTLEASDNAGFENSGGAQASIQIASVHNQPGVDVLANGTAFTGANQAFTGFFDWLSPQVAAGANLTVAGNNIGAGGQYFSAGSFAIANATEQGVGGFNYGFDVDDGATSASPDFTDVSSIADVPERNPSNFVLIATALEDDLGNAFDLAATPVSVNGNNRSNGWGKDRTAVAVTSPLPTPGQTIILNPFDQDAPANAADNNMSFTAMDPALADGAPGSGTALGITNAAQLDDGTTVNVGGGPNNFTINTQQAALGGGVAGAGDGSYNVTVTTSDAATAANTTQTVFNIIRDSTDPNTNIINPPSNAVTTSNATATFTIQGSATDANGLSSVLVTVRDDTPGGGGTSGNNTCELSDPLVSASTNNATQDQFNVTGSASSFSVNVTLNNPQPGFTNPQNVCFFIEAKDNAKDVNGNLEPNTSDQSAATDITWN